VLYFGLSIKDSDTIGKKVVNEIMMGLGGLFISLIIFGLAIGAMIFWIMMLVDVTKRKFPKKEDKTVWVLVVALTGVIGALIYYFIAKKKGK